MQRLFWPAVTVSLAVKLVLAAAIPITSDEAYFTIWGRSFDLGYYDHPPMIGWLLYLISFVGDSAVLIRLPAVLSTIFIAFGVYSLLKPLDESKAASILVLLLVSPFNLLNVFITTDTPFIFFSFLSAWFLFHAQKRAGYTLYLLSGAALGAAFLSKYFAVFLGLAYVAFFISSRKDAKRTRGFALLFLSAMPFVALNIAWNYNHDWTNIMFNAVNRNKGESYSLVKVLGFLASQAYLMTPAAVYYLVRHSKELKTSLTAAKSRIDEAGYALFAFVFATPLVLFALLSVRKAIGLHWVLGFYSFMYILLFFLMTEEELVATIKLTAVFSLVHLFLVGAVLAVPIDYFQGKKYYSTLVMVTKPGEVRKRLDNSGGTFVLATPSYASSALLTYHLGDYFMVFGVGSHHGRQDDIRTDYRKFDGKDILILRTSEPKDGEYSPFFKDVKHERLTIEGAQFSLVRGYAFKYTNYRDVVLREIKEKYYDIPAWLPNSHNGDFFKKYFKSTAPRRPRESRPCGRVRA